MIAIASPARAQNFTMTVTGAGTGNGTVTAPAAGSRAAINCAITAGVTSGPCQRTYPQATVVTLTATAAVGHFFHGWTGGCAANGTNPQCVLSNLTGPVPVTATFQTSPPPAQCTLTVQSGTGGSATITSGGATGNCGRSVTVQATPDANFSFQDWSQTGTSLSTDNPYTFVLNADDTILASFVAAAPCVLTLDVTPVNGGSASITTGNASGPCGRTVTATAVPATGFEFTSWSDGATTATRQVTVTSAAQQLTATFTAVCTLSVAAGTGGSAAITGGNATGACGRQVTVQATADANNTFTGWTENGAPVSTDNPWILTLSADRVLTATFTPVVPQCTLTLDASPANGGTVALTAGTLSGDCGRSVTALATPATGFLFSSWSDGATAASHAVTVSTTAQTLTAAFTPAPPAQCTITLSAGAGGTAAVSAGGATGACGRSVTMLATPGATSTFTAWTENGAQASTDNPWTFTLSADRTLAATFTAIPQCTITLDAAPVNGGTVALTAGSATGACGRSVTVAATPAATFSFGSWQRNGAEVSNANPFTFTLTEDMTLQAVFAAIPQCAVSVQPSVGGSATITAGTPTGACGRSVTVLATPDANFRFDRWSDGGTTNPHTVVLTAPTLTLQPTFVAQCTLSVTAAPNDGGTAAITGGAATGDCGRSVTVQATPGATWSFAGWTENGSTVNTTTPWTFTLATSRTLTASFAAIPQCALTIGTATGGAATLTNGTLTGACGRSVTVQATATNGYRFGSWSDGSTASPYTLTLSATTLTLTPAFVQQCTLTLARTPSNGGTVALSAGTLTGDCGRTATAVATAATGFDFASWSDGQTPATRPVTISQPAQTLTATFAPLCTLSVTATTGGSVAIANGGATGLCGRSVTIAATPNVNVAFTGWSENGATVSTATPFSFLLTADRALVANFAAIPQCALAIGTATGGSATLTSGTLTGACGRSVTVQATVGSGYRFRIWSDSATANPYTLVVNTPTKTLTPIFAQQCALTLVAEPANGGSVTLTDGALAGDCGRVVTARAIPAATFDLVRWSDTATAATRPLVVNTVAQRLTATFAQQECTVTIGSASGGRAAVTSGSASGVCGRTVTLTATPDSAFRFRIWSDSSTTNPYSIVTGAGVRALTVTPQFVAQCELELSAAPATGGTVTLTAGTRTGDCGRSVTALATPNAGFRFSGWSEAATTPSYTFTVTQGLQRLSARFTASSTVRVTISGAQGSVRRTANNAEVCALTDLAAEKTCDVTPTGAEEFVAMPSATTGFIGWEGACTGRGVCAPTGNDVRLVRAQFVAVRTILANDAALDLLTGQGLSTADRELLDRTGNGDGVYNLGDLLAHMERTNQTLSLAISTRVMGATTPLSQPIRPTTTRTPRKP